MKIAFLVTTSLIVTLTTQAYAGFQFTAPVEQPQVSMQPAQGALLPIVGNQSPQAMPAVPAAPVVHAPIPVVEAATNSGTQMEPNPPHTINKAPDTGMMSLARPMENNQNTYGVAVGFGNDLPLVTALRQIIPSDYSYVLDKNITVGQTVSWNGGQEWPTVLNETISGLNLSSTINDKIVTISKNDAPVMAQAPKPVNSAMVVEAPKQEPINVLPPVQPKMTMAPVPVAQAPQPIVHDSVTVVDTSNGGDVQLPQPGPIETQWMAQSGESLKTTLEAWSNIAGVDLFWSSDYDYPLSSDVSVSGEFTEAVEMLLAGFSLAQPKPVGRLHPNLPNGPAVLILETQQVTR